jgi:hypothetical protein
MKKTLLIYVMLYVATGHSMNTDEVESNDVCHHRSFCFSDNQKFIEYLKKTAEHEIVFEEGQTGKLSLKNLCPHPQVYFTPKPLLEKKLYSLQRKPIARIILAATQTVSEPPYVPCHIYKSLCEHVGNNALHAIVKHLQTISLPHITSYLETVNQTALNKKRFPLVDCLIDVPKATIDDDYLQFILCYANCSLQADGSCTIRRMPDAMGNLTTRPDEGIGGIELDKQIYPKLRDRMGDQKFVLLCEQLRQCEFPLIGKTLSDLELQATLCTADCELFLEDVLEHVPQNITPQYPSTVKILPDGNFRFETCVYQPDRKAMFSFTKDWLTIYDSRETVPCLTKITSHVFDQALKDVHKPYVNPEFARRAEEIQKGLPQYN